jgi:hypothetical protein
MQIALLCSLWSPFAHQEKPDALEQLRGCVHAFWQEDVRVGVPIIDPNFARQQDGGRLRRNGFDLGDNSGTIDTWHDEIAQDQINSALAETFDGFFAVCTGDYAVATGFEEDFANGEGLLIIVNAQDRSLWLHDWGRHARLKQFARPAIKKTSLSFIESENSDDENPTKKDAIRKVARMLMAQKCRLKFVRECESQVHWRYTHVEIRRKLRRA